jgi:hypothetical protein
LLEDGLEVERIRFWPFLAHPDCIGCEPDVDILFRGRDGKRAWVVIEAKYRSGKSSSALEEEERPNDQLAREFDNLKNFSQRGHINRYALVYLSTDYTCPRKELQDSISEYEKKRGSRPDIYWLSWRMLSDVLETANYSGYEIIMDLNALLARLNMTMFRRLRTNELRRAKWNFERTPRQWMWKPPRPKWSFVTRQAEWQWDSLPRPEKWHFQNLSTGEEGQTKDG